MSRLDGPDEPEVISLFLRHIERQGDLPLGDDAGALRFGGLWLVATSDMLIGRTDVPGIMKPEQIGFKVVTMNVSDVVAMGARPIGFLFSLGLPAGTPREYIEGLARGINRGSIFYDVPVLSGDTNEACDLVIDGTAIGTTETPVTRAGARPGDLVCVSGDLGRPLAALMLYERRVTGGWTEPLYEKLLEPKARLDLLDAVKRATAAIDISDGLAKELNTLAEMSGVSIVVREDAVPIGRGVDRAAELLGVDPLALALRSGEEFELLLTISGDDVPEGFTVIGEVREGSGVYVETDGRLEELPPLGWEHLSSHGTR
ncbi:MAG: thiamine-phosphate kinase [Thermococci archaeon]|nr:thiamine-phosphate kinase [Thermococci archaeon]